MGEGGQGNRHAAGVEFAVRSPRAPLKRWPVFKEQPHVHRTRSRATHHRARITTDLPPAAMHWAKVGILDTVGVTLAGCHDPSARIARARASVRQAGRHIVFGSDRARERARRRAHQRHRRRTRSISTTATIRSAAIRRRPSLPALFALADEHGADGREFIAAYVAGFETECKIGLAVNFYPLHARLASDRPHSACSAPPLRARA